MTVLNFADTHFLPYQRKWIGDNSPLKLIEKSRQIGLTFADAYDSVMKACAKDARHDVWVSSRDQTQAKLYLRDCMNWARLLQKAAVEMNEKIYDGEEKLSAQVLEFANGSRIYSLSSNPNALAGKRGHVKLDEFALHKDQRLLYQVAKPVTQWGGQLSIISTHRGAQSVFNELIRDIRERGNPMGWNLHSVPLANAVAEGLAERINAKSGRNETGDQFMARLRSECIDVEQWQQEYCCQPADESSAFITYDMIVACADAELKLLSFEELARYAVANPKAELFLGVDVARKHDLCVLDVGERLGDVIWDRLRIELRGRTFGEIEAELYRLLKLKQLKRACIDQTGLGAQLAERASERFPWSAEGVTFTAAVKEELAFGLRLDFEDRRVRICDDEPLRSDLRAMRKEITTSGNIRFAGESADSHCDRFWAKALRQQAARHRVSVGGGVA
jgi:phage FluMu gp28-like protein